MYLVSVSLENIYFIVFSQLIVVVHEVLLN